MLLSMTGYGAGHLDQDGVSVAVEIRSVNNRYLKLHCRLPDGYAVLEPRIEETVRQAVRRGAIQLNLDIRRKTSAEDYQLNTELLTSYVQQICEVRRTLGEENPLPSDVDLESVLMLPGVVAEDQRQASHAEDDWPLVQQALQSALSELTSMREKEGQAMTADLETQTNAIESAAAEVEQLAPQVVEAYQTRLTERLNKLLAQHDVEVQPGDIVREVGVFAERADISEEIVRLRSHLVQFRDVMKQNAAGAGRKLEFLVQELLRETNTIGSKANDAEIAKRVVHVKTCIERIREMVQNVE